MRAVLAFSSTIAVVAAVAVGTQVIGEDDTDTPQTSSGGQAGRDYEWSTSPAPLLLVLPDGDREIDTLGEWTSPSDEDGSYSTGFSDGGWTPLAELEDAGKRGTLDFWFGMPGWTWQAELIDIREDPEDMDWCARKALVRATGEQTFTVEPVGPAGTYRLTLSGRGPEGDRNAELRWTTTERGGDSPEECL